MLIVAVVVIVAFGLAAFAVTASKTYKLREQRDARIERRRIRARDWWVQQWLRGRGDRKRLTDQRQWRD